MKKIFSFGVLYLIVLILASSLGHCNADDVGAPPVNATHANIESDKLPNSTVPQSTDQKQNEATSQNPVDNKEPTLEQKAEMPNNSQIANSSQTTNSNEATNITLEENSAAATNATNNATTQSADTPINSASSQEPAAAKETKENKSAITTEPANTSTSAADTSIQTNKTEAEQVKQPAVETPKNETVSAPTAAQSKAEPELKNESKATPTAIPEPKAQPVETPKPVSDAATHGSDNDSQYGLSSDQIPSRHEAPMDFDNDADPDDLFARTEMWQIHMSDFDPSEMVTFRVEGGESEDLFENVNELPSRIRGIYFVSSHQGDTIDLIIRDPVNVVLYAATKKTQGFFFFNATHKGLSYANNVVFTLEVDQPQNEKFGPQHIGPMEEQISRFTKSLEEIQAGTKFSKLRQHTYHTTAKREYTSVFLWALIETIAIIGIGAWQAMFVKHLFDNRRII